MANEDRLIKLEGVSVEQLELLDDKVLVRVLPREQTRASGLVVLEGSPEHQVGSEFYGEVVKVGPGSFVREGPTPEEAGDLVRKLLAERRERDLPVEREALLDCIRDEVVKLFERRRPMRRVPPPWKPGDQVLVKQGFGVEMDLREGRHHVIERAGKFGHGILASWDKDHVHCWHQTRGDRIECACGALAPETFESRLPACVSCPPGPRLAEAVLGGKHIYDVKIPSAPKVKEFDPERAQSGGFSAGELRPE